MMDAYQIVDKKTNEKLVGFHDGMGIYEFDRTSRPHEIYATMDEIVDICGRIERFTGRKVTMWSS